MSATEFDTVRHFAMEAPFLASFSKSYGQTSLKLGQVSSIIFPGESGNNTNHPLYSVWVYTGMGKSLWHGVTKMEALGSTHAYSETTLTPITNVTEVSEQGVTEASQMNGTMVLLLCVHGDTNQAYIVGCAPHLGREANGPEHGQHSYHEFNGVSLRLTKDGTVNLVFDAPKDEEGRRTVDDGPTTIDINHSSVALKAKAASMAVDDTFALNANAASIAVDDTLALGDKDAAQSVVRGDKYRSQEEKLHAGLKADLLSLSASLSELAINLASAGLALTAYGGASLGTAASAASKAAKDAANAAAKIESFELQSSTYLSKKVKVD